MNIAENITELIGRTPLVKINGMNTDGYANVFAKLEFFNPCSSVKDRIGLAMIESAERDGLISSATTIIEPTSGNTGVGLAFVCASKGYKLILTMPDTMSIERRSLLKALGAEIVLTEGKLGMRGAVDEAYSLKNKIKDSIVLQQFQNKANPEIHKKTTALEIWNDTDGSIDIFVSGVGTGGTITGVGEVLKEKNNNIQIVAVEPEDSPVLSGGNPGSHRIQGIGAGFIPDVLNKNIIDEVVKVKNENAEITARILAKKEGVFCGISSGAALWATLLLSKREENKNKNIVVILPDTGERYLSTRLFSDPNDKDTRGL